MADENHFASEEKTLKNRRRGRANSIREVLPSGPISSIARRAGRVAFDYVYILHWLPKYTKDDIICDIIAGITTGLTMLPQSIAYALLAGLSPQYGLYSSFIGQLIYIIFGTVKEVSMGPSSLMALLTFEFTQDLPIDFVVLLTFLVGCVELLFGILHLGVLVEFISAPVVSGFTTATSVVIAEAQMKGLLGIKYKSVGFIDNTKKLFINIKHTKLADALLGVASIIFLLSFRKLKDIPVSRCKLFLNSGKETEEKKLNDPRSTEKKIKKFLWFLTIGRNALIVLIGGTIGFVLERNWGKAPFALSGQISPGFPPVRPPPFSTTHANNTYNFGEMASELGSGILIIPVVSVLANIAIAKAYSTGGKTYATQEMITLGICNMAGSFFSSMPTCGAFTRSAVSDASGVRTPLAGLYTGILIMLALGFLTPYFYYIPRSTLSAVLISAVVFMTDFRIFRTLWQNSKRDFVAALGTFVVCLTLGLEMGLLLGVAINCSFLLYLWARPALLVDHKKVSSGHEYIMVTPDTGLYFPATDFIRSELGRIGVSEGGGVQPLVLNCSHLKGFDYSAAKGVIGIFKEFESRQQPLILFKLKDDALSLLENCATKAIVHCNNEEELELVLYSEHLDCEDTSLLKGVKDSFTVDVNSSLLEKHLTLEITGGSSDQKSLH